MTVRTGPLLSLASIRHCPVERLELLRECCQVRKYVSKVVLAHGTNINGRHPRKKVGIRSQDWVVGFLFFFFFISRSVFCRALGISQADFHVHKASFI